MKVCFGQRDHANRRIDQNPGTAPKRSVFLHIESGSSVSDEKHSESVSKFGNIDAELIWLKSVGSQSFDEIVKYHAQDHDIDEINAKSKERVFSSRYHY